MKIHYTSAIIVLLLSLFFVQQVHTQEEPVEEEIVEETDTIDEEITEDEFAEDDELIEDDELTEEELNLAEEEFAEDLEEIDDEDRETPEDENISEKTKDSENNEETSNRELEDEEEANEKDKDSKDFLDTKTPEEKLLEQQEKLLEEKRKFLEEKERFLKRKQQFLKEQQPENEEQEIIEMPLKETSSPTEKSQPIKKSTELIQPAQPTEQKDFIPDGDGYFFEFVPRGMALASKFGEYRYFQDDSTMLFVPEGEFFMGGNSFANTKPLKKISIPGYYIDKYEVTIEQYKQFCYAMKKPLPQQPIGSTNNHPVVNVSWQEADAYAKWVRKSLPTEAQWEKAARGGIQIPNWGIQKRPISMRRNRLPIRLYTWGNFPPYYKNIYRCNYRANDTFATKGKDGFDFVAPRGSFAKYETSVYGCNDLSGNVREWCSDTYEGRHSGKSSKEFEINAKKTVRGGGWNSDAKRCRVSYRSFSEINYRSEYLGFRLVKNVE